MGVAVTSDPELATRLKSYRTFHGAIPGPWEAWLVLRGLRTLHLRVERAGENAAELARRLRDHPAVERVRHPSLPDDPGHARAAAQMSGFGAIVSVEVRGGAAAATRVCEGTRLWLHATSLGGVESMLERRRRHAGEAPEVPENLLRLSVGVEDVEDLWHDLDRALAASRTG
jgi:cystathionine gamma-synthase